MHATCNIQPWILFLASGTLIAGEAISTTEYEDLNRSHAYLTDLVERQGIPVFSDINTALKCAAKTVKQVSLRGGEDY